MTIRITFNTEQQGPKFRRAMKRRSDAILAASRGAAEDAAETALKDARAQIREAGNFGSRWSDGLNYRIGEGGGSIRITFTHLEPLWIVHQEGRVIHGKPLLWIPLPWADDAKGVNARDYPEPMFRVDRLVGSPLLMTHDGEAKYVGKEQVTIPKRFRILEIIAETARQMRAFYSRRIRQG